MQDTGQQTHPEKAQKRTQKDLQSLCCCYTVGQDKGLKKTTHV